MTDTIEVRRARLADAERIAAFVNSAQASTNDTDGDLQHDVTRRHVVERFSQVGFMIAEQQNEIVGLLGWQVENLVVRVTDYLITAPDAAALDLSRELVDKMEEEAHKLQAEAALLFLPPHPTAALVAFWEHLGYNTEHLDTLSKACREAVNEWGLDADRVMVKPLRQRMVGRPL